MTDRDNILKETNGGLDVFVHYMGEKCKKKLFRNPFRDDASPSCHLYYHEDQRGGEGRFILKDFGDSDWHGDCFWLVARITGLNVRNDFMEILRIIDKELNLFKFDDAPAGYHPVMNKVKSERLPDNRPIKFLPKYRNFNKYELEYWRSYGIGIDTLWCHDVRCLSSCYFERADGTHYNVYGTIDVPMFGYTFYNGSGIKVYRPNAQIGRFMYAGMLPKPYVFGLEQAKNVCQPYLIVTGGEKDVLSLCAHGFNAICLNSETAKVPPETLLGVCNRYKSIIFLYDTDETGKRETALRVKEWNEYVDKNKALPHSHGVQLPLSGLKQDKDVSDFFRSGHSTDELCDIILTSIETTNE